MFGYVRPRKSELLVREYDEYRGIYCSLCRQLGKRYGLLSRMTLNYDCTFLTLVSLGLSGACPGFREGKCVTNPLKKCVYCSEEGKAFALPAALSVILTYYKLRDDLSDSRFFGRLRARLLLLLGARAHRRASADFPELESCARETMAEQSACERDPDVSVDACAEPTALLLAKAFSLLSEEESPRLVLREFGYYLGRWVYLIDAADDLSDDLQHGSFNPFVRRFALSPGSTEEQLREARARCNEALNLTLARASAALNLLELNQLGPIISNVVLLGLPQMQKERLFERKKEKKHV